MTDARVEIVRNGELPINEAMGLREGASVASPTR